MGPMRRRIDYALVYPLTAWNAIAVRIGGRSRAANLNTHVRVVSLLSRPAGSVKGSDDLLTECGGIHGPSTFGAF